MQPEKVIQNEILEFLEAKQIFCFSVRNGAVYDPVRKVFRSSKQRKGISDILGVLPGGRAFAIEVKTKTGRLSPEQKEFIKEFNEEGGLAFVARSLEDVEETLFPAAVCDALDTE